MVLRSNSSSVSSSSSVVVVAVFVYDVTFGAAEETILRDEYIEEVIRALRVMASTGGAKAIVLTFTTGMRAGRHWQQSTGEDTVKHEKPTRDYKVKTRRLQFSAAPRRETLSS